MKLQQHYSHGLKKKKNKLGEQSVALLRTAKTSEVEFLLKKSKQGCFSNKIKANKVGCLKKFCKTFFAGLHPAKEKKEQNKRFSKGTIVVWFESPSCRTCVAVVSEISKQKKVSSGQMGILKKCCST